MNPEDLGWMSEAQREAIIADMAAALVAETEHIHRLSWVSGFWQLHAEFIIMRRLTGQAEDPRPGGPA